MQLIETEKQMETLLMVLIGESTEVKKKVTEKTSVISGRKQIKKPGK